MREKFSDDRIAFVLACALKGTSDGRIAKEVKDFARDTLQECAGTLYEKKSVPQFPCGTGKSVCESCHEITAGKTDGKTCTGKERTAEIPFGSTKNQSQLLQADSAGGQSDY